ncbi:MAG: bifunctional glycosyltransferase family 2/GtrA family protein [Ruminococcus sp.]|nr:bifunctional glycosyltransferase family 2/GtrA family protein [Ruminococcus sp.]
MNNKIALIPAYCPCECLADIARDLSRKDYSVIIINDGSGSEYDQIFSRAGEFAQIVEHGKNRGKGAALRTGLEYILSGFVPPYTVVTLDADGQHSVADTEKVVSAAEKFPERLILGSRDFKGKVPAKSLIGNTITRAVFRLSSGVKVRDTQTGLRAFSDSHIKRMLDISGDRYEYEMNVLMEYAKAGLTITEVPIETIYIDDNSSSHFDPIQDSCRIYREILKFSASSLACFGIDYVLFCILSGLSLPIASSNVLARIVSSGVNYDLNRKMVFKSKASVKRSAFQYFSLALFILMCNTMLLQLITEHTPINRYAAKIITEMIMFIVSWTVQKTVIFRIKGEKAHE